MKGLGVEYVRGFLYSKPMPAVEFEQWLRERAEAQADRLSFCER